MKRVRKAMTKGVGKQTKAKRLRWDDAWTQVIHTDPCGLIVREGEKGEPVIEKRIYTKKNAWVIELLDRNTREWAFSVFLNLDKVADGKYTRFSHTLDWCMQKLKREAPFFEKGTFDVCEARIRNRLDDNMVMAAVLL